MDWFTVQGSLRDHPKWTDLSPLGRGAWITLMTIGHGQPGSKRWRLGKPPHVLSQLRREGFTGPMALEALAELVAAGLVDIDQDSGMVSLHDASDHQRFPSDAPDRVAERQRRFREKRKAEQSPDTPANTTVTAGNGGSNGGNEDRQTRQTRQTERRGPSRACLSSNASHEPVGSDLRDHGPLALG